MSIAKRLKWYLDSRGISYECIRHSHTHTALASARAARVPARVVAKCVLLEDERGYVLAVVPASRSLDLAKIEEKLHRHLELASEEELEQIFPDCEPGAVPALGPAYGIPTLLDEKLFELTDLFFEAGDHEDLVHMEGPDFVEMLAGSLHGRFTQTV